ncbi:MAG: MlaD family protein [Bacteroidia bacterium]
MRIALATVIFVAVAAGLVYGAFRWGLGWQEKYVIYWAPFDDATGLRPRDPVLYRGFEVGRVQRILLTPDQVWVALEINPDYPLPMPTRAIITLKEILTGKQVVLIPGSSVSFHQPGDTLQTLPTWDWSTVAAHVIQNFPTWQKKSDTLYQEIYAFFRRIQALPWEKLAAIPEQLAAYQKLAQTLETTLYQAQPTLKALPSTLYVAETTLKAFHSLTPKVDTLLALLPPLIARSESLLRQIPPTSLAYRALYDSSLALRIDTVLDQLEKTLIHVRKRKIHVGVGLSHKPRTFPEP